ncbi:sodium-dependent transporter [Anaeromicrobium sediminis]|uniref:sodium-dependent transporter n=1 Tax=Anaeromicrobium sediminis TaxID=1478221 RepID=UPI001FA83020|nr:sodium-dependent transporter [Anaeromicrobium sediminis]
MKDVNQEREQWGSKVGFILAAAGSAVGLGNLWKFPYVAGKNGGGAFVLVYFIILFLVGFTLMLAEIALGRHTQLNAIGAYRKLREKWAFVGGLGVLAAFMLLSFYSVVGGWVINYVIKSVTGGLNVSDPEVLGNMFGEFVANRWTPIIYHAIFMLLTLLIVLGGVGGGIEKASKIMMPALFGFIILLAVRAVTLPGGIEGVKYLLVPDFSKINMEVILSALGQVFFSLSLGMGCMITYGSYLGKDTNIPESAVIIPLCDTAIALLAGLAVLPAVFAFGFEPAAGPGLIFVTLPAVFSQMPLGNLFAIMFFILVLFAALTSSISLLEVCVAYVVDEWGWNRKLTTWTLAGLIFAIGVPASLSMGPWADIHLLGDRGFFDTYDYIVSNWLLPLGGLLLCIFVGWIWGTDAAIKEVTNNGTLEFKLRGLWVFLIKYVGPVAILVVFVRSLT